MPADQEHALLTKKGRGGGGGGGGGGSATESFPFYITVPDVRQLLTVH